MKEKLAVTSQALGTFNVVARCYGNSASTGCGASDAGCVYDNACANTQETSITQLHLGGGAGVMAQMPVDDRIFAQPLYLSSVYINQWAIAVEGNEVYVSSGTSIDAWSSNTGASDGTIANNQSGIVALAVDASNVYWLNVNGGSCQPSIAGAVMACALGGCNDSPVRDHSNMYPPIPNGSHGRSVQPPPRTRTA